jgi:hypothetical protein
MNNIDQLCVELSKLKIINPIDIIDLTDSIDSIDPIDIIDLTNTTKPKLIATIDLTLDEETMCVTTRGCVYFLKLLTHTNLYKYGSTSDIKKRLQTHKRNKLYGPHEVLAIVDCDMFHTKVESHVKKIAVDSFELTSLGPHKEIIKTTDISKYILAAKKNAMTYDGYVTHIIQN